MKALKSIATGVLLLTCLQLLGDWFWVFELMSHFAWWYLQLGLLFLVFFKWLSTSHRFAVIAIILINFTLIHRDFESRSEILTDEHKKNQLSLLVFNVHNSNRSVERLVSLVNENSPDILLFIELIESVESDLYENIREAYPHRSVEFHDGHYSIVMYSKLKWTKHQILNFSEYEIPWFDTKFDVHGKEITLCSVHAPPPISPYFLQLRNQLLDRACSNKNYQNAILVGDFNLTPYAAHFHEILEQIAWKDSRRGFGVANTWPSFLPDILRIPIDHILFRGDLVVVERQVLASHGSDHLPIMIKFSVKT